MKIVNIICITFLIFGCDPKSSNDIVIKDLSFEVSINPEMLDGNIKNNENVQVNFRIENTPDNFSHIEIAWEHRLGADTFRTGFTQFRSQDFTTEGAIQKYTYFKNEEFIYDLVFPNLDSLTSDSQFELIWIAYDLDDLPIASNNPEDLIISISCDLSDDFLKGEYILQSEATSDFWVKKYLIDNDTIVFTEGSNQNIRSAKVKVFDLDATLNLVLHCGKIGVSNKPIEVSCGDGIVFFSESFNPISVDNDNEVVVDFIFDYYNDCGVTQKEQLTLTRINR